MTIAQTATQKIEDYLKEVRAGLHGIPNAQAVEIVQELRSHILDRAETAGEVTEAAVAAALERLGRPKEVAAMYVAENIVTRAEKSFSPWLVLKGLFRWAGISTAGVFVFFTSLTGYVIAVSLAISAMMKPLAPGRVGLWRIGEDNYSLRMGLTSTPPSGTELLGWWIIPVGLTFGIGLFLLTSQFGLWSLRKFQQMRAKQLN
jgi:hypothetical protein